MTNLVRLHDELGQSPWLDNLTRAHLRDGTLARMVTQGVRGVTANPTILARAIEGSDAYDDQFAALVAGGSSVRDAYWALVVADVEDACTVLRPVFDGSDGSDGFVSIEVAPELARDTDATVAAARELHARIERPNLLVKVPATAEGVPAIRTLTSEGHSINVTLVFSLARYEQVLDAHLDGLEAFAAAGGDASTVRSVASFFVSRVDTEVDRRLDAAGAPAELRGRAAIAQAKLAYQRFGERFSGARWERLAARGARMQRPLWASTSTKDPARPDTLYVDGLIGPDSVTTLPEATIAAFEDHGRLERTVDADLGLAHDTMRRLAAVGIDLDDVGLTLEDEGVAAFERSFQSVLGELATRASRFAHR
jgi:transaldolase